jgi:putative redox protein
MAYICTQLLTMALLKANLAEGDFGMDIVDADGHLLRLDIPVAQGGNGTGFRPMQTILAALIGCSAVDVVSILKKQKQTLVNLSVEIDGQREEGKEPSLWKTIDVVFKLSGEIDTAKAIRAVDLSIKKYCSVAETLRAAGAEIKYKIFVNDQEVFGQ